MARSKTKYSKTNRSRIADMISSRRLRSCTAVGGNHAAVNLPRGSSIVIGHVAAAAGHGGETDMQHHAAADHEVGSCKAIVLLRNLSAREDLSPCPFGPRAGG